MSYLLFGGGLYMVLMALVWLVQPSRNVLNHYFAAMYSSTGLIVLYAWAERTGFIYSVFPLYNIQIPLCYTFAPLLYYGFSQITDLRHKPATLFLPHFIPAIVSFPLVIANNLLNASMFASLPVNVSPSDFQGRPTFFVIHLLGLGSNAYILFFLFRILLIGARLLRDRELENFKELGLLLAFVAWFAADIILMVVAHLLRKSELLYLGKFLSSSCFVAYSFYSFRYPEYAQKVYRKSKQLRYKNTQLRGLNTEELLSRLDYLMTKEKLFKDMELTLARLSAQLMVTPHQLSEIFSECLKVNFRTYLNDHRVREAEQLLIKRPEDSILDIAFESGFNSKASFNDNFARKTGLADHGWIALHPHHYLDGVLGHSGREVEGGYRVLEAIAVRDERLHLERAR
jgi:AraC-like DNA-binding protein